MLIPEHLTCYCSLACNMVFKNTFKDSVFIQLKKTNIFKGFLSISLVSCLFVRCVHGSAQFGSSCPETLPTCVVIEVLSHGIEDKQIHSCSVKQVLKWISSLCSSVSSYSPRLLFLIFPSLQLSIKESAADFSIPLLLHIYFHFQHWKEWVQRLQRSGNR